MTVAKKLNSFRNSRNISIGTKLVTDKVISVIAGTPILALTPNTLLLEVLGITGLYLTNKVVASSLLSALNSVGY